MSDPGDVVEPGPDAPPGSEGEGAPEAPAKRGPGRPKGSRDRKPRKAVEMTPALRRAQALRAFKNGKFAKLATLAEGRMEILRRLHPELPELIEAAIDAVGGDLEEWQKTGALSLVELEITRRALVDRIHEDGVIVQDVTRDIKTKEEVPTETIRLKAHPLLEPARKIHKELGFTADDMRLTKKSRGAGDVDDAKAALLRRRVLLQQGRARMAAPIDVTPEPQKKLASK